MKIENVMEIHVAGLSHVLVNFNFSYQMSHIISPLLGVNEDG